MTTVTAAPKSKQALQGSRLNAFAMDPKDLTLVTDPNHPLFDLRSTMPADETLVKSIMRVGVKNPILVRKNGKNEDGTDVVEVVDGRRRYIATLEANRRLLASGEDESMLIRIPCMLEKGNETDAMETMLLTNEQRLSDDPLNKAAKVVRLLGRGRTEEEVAELLGCSVAAVKDLVKLHSAPDEVRAAVKDGKVNQTVAIKLSELPKQAAVEQLQEIEKSPEKVTAAQVSAKVKEAKTGKPARVAPGKKEIKKMIAEMPEDHPVALALLWAIGEGDKPELRVERVTSTVAAVLSDRKISPLRAVGADEDGF